MDIFLKQVPLSHRVVGYRQVVRGISDNQIRCVLIARDADSDIVQQMTMLCQKNNIPYRLTSNKSAMGKKLNLDVACAVCGQKHEAKNQK